MKAITLLTGNGCPACKTLKQRLDSAGLLDKVIELNVHESPSGRSMMNSLGVRSIPVLADTSQGKPKTLIGSNQSIEVYKEFIL